MCLCGEQASQVPAGTSVAQTYLNALLILQGQIAEGSHLQSLQIFLSTVSPFYLSCKDLGFY